MKYGAGACKCWANGALFDRSRSDFSIACDRPNNTTLSITLCTSLACSRLSALGPIFHFSIPLCQSQSSPSPLLRIFSNYLLKLLAYPCRCSSHLALLRCASRPSGSVTQLRVWAFRHQHCLICQKFATTVAIFCLGHNSAQPPNVATPVRACAARPTRSGIYLSS